MNLANKELEDTKFEVLLCYCCLSILILFPLTSTNIFLCAKVFGKGKKRVQFSQLLPVTAKNSIHVSKSKTLLLNHHKPDTHLSN